MPPFGAGDQLIDDLGLCSSVAMDTVDAVIGTAEKVHDLAQVPNLAQVTDGGHIPGCDEHRDHSAAHQRELAVAHELVKQEHETVEHLHRALRSRDVIGQAKGILMERHKIGSEAAFALLQHESSRSHRKLTDIAAQLAYTG